MDIGGNIFCAMGSGACGRVYDWGLDLAVLRDLGYLSDRATRYWTRARQSYSSAKNVE